MADAATAGLATLTQQLLWAAFALGLAFGALAQRTHFCTMGALAGGMFGVGMVLAWALWRPEGRQASVLLGGLGVGSLVVALWAVSGIWGHLAEHPLTLEPAWLATSRQRMESLSFVAPPAWLLEAGLWAGDGSRRLSQGMVLVPGVVLGSAAVALATGSFRWEGVSHTADLVRHLLGAVLMGVGGVCASGCSIGQGITGLSTLSLGSFPALSAIVPGAVATLRLQSWWLMCDTDAA